MDANEELLMEASYINQNRVHAGFHYPRSIETALESLDAYDSFEERFDECLRKYDNYYAIASEGSLTSTDRYAEFLETLGKSRNVRFDEVKSRPWFLNPDTTAAIYRVHEPVVDIDLVRAKLKKEISESHNLDVRLGTRAIRLLDNSPFVVQTTSGQYRGNILVNASYGNINWHNHPLAPTVEVQLVEMVEVNSNRTLPGVTIMDGPFCAILPLGLSNNRYWYYSVNYSVHARIETRSCLNFRPAFYSNWDRMLEQGRQFFSFMDNLSMVQSHFTARTFMLGREIDETAARLSRVYEIEDGFYQILSGKLITCIKVAHEVEGKILG